ncbi:hypothetical protein B9J78_05790 [bacterium Unc6]|nr:hypothetical protein [bacterium Unc6]
MFKQRMNNIQDILRHRGLDFLITTNPSNIFYLTGFRCEEAVLLISKESSFFFVDARYIEEARPVIKDSKVIEVRWATFKKYLQNFIGLKSKIGYDLSQTYCSQIKKWETCVPNSMFIDASGIPESLRICKSEQEIRSIKDSIELTKIAIQDIIKLDWSKITERHLAWEIEKKIREKGAEAVSFPIIVASGKRSSYPHATPQDINIEKDIVLIDCGCRLKGYCSDITRTYTNTSGARGLKFTKIKSIVETASKIVIEKIRAGVQLKDIDSIARGYIEKKGFGKNFIHSLGHGVGIDVHEAPDVGSGSKDIAKEGMVLTIEPAIYIKGVGGVRYEQMVLVHESGCEVLS